MLSKQPFLRASAVWWTGLLVFALILTGCGGATDSTSNSAEPAANNQAEQAAEEPTTNEQTEEVAVQEEAEPEAELEPQAGESQQSTSSAVAECRTATPENDPLMALLQPNTAIAPVSEDDWSKGPADAPLTIIEYGDFQ